MWFLDMVQKYVLIEPKFYGIDDQILGLFGGRTRDQEDRENRENRARDIVLQRKAAMEQWRRVGRAGPVPAPEWLTDKDRAEIQRTEDFKKVQTLRDNPVLGSNSFTSILSPKRSTKGKSVTTVSGGTSPGGPPRSTFPGSPTPDKPDKPVPGGAFGGGSVLASRKRKRTILG